MGQIAMSDPSSSNPHLQTAILRFWAQGMDITQTFSQAEINSVPGLAAAIETVRVLPSLAGWDEEDASMRKKDL